MHKYQFLEWYLCDFLFHESENNFKKYDLEQ